MSTREIANRWLSWGLGAVLLGLGAVTVASAHGGDTARIHACVNNNSGAFQLVRANEVCANNQTAVDWNIVGPQGPAGPTGPQGPPGVSGYERIMTLSVADSVTHKSGRADCPAGKRVLGGGAAIGGATFSTTMVTESYPQYRDKLDGWEAHGVEVVPDSANWYVIVHAICATVAP